MPMCRRFYVRAEDKSVIALVILFFLAIYLLITAVVMGLASRWARRHGRRGWVWAGVAAFGMYNLVFWDLIPTLLVHKYYCETQAGFWVYKTPEEWRDENPGVLETLSVSHLPEEYREPKRAEWVKCNGMSVARSDWFYVLPDGTCLKTRPDQEGKIGYVKFASPDGTHGFQLNERIRWSWKFGDRIPFIGRITQEVVDFKTNTVLARHVGFSWGSGWSIGSGRGNPNWMGGLGTYFLGTHGCPIDEHNEGKLWSFKNQLRGKGSE